MSLDRCGQKEHDRFMKDTLQKIEMTLVVGLPILAVIIAAILLWNRYVFILDMVLFAIFYLLSGIGITIGYHRMLTHEGFKTPAPIRAFFLICGCFSFQGAPDTWAALHVKHHAHSDEDGDPHSPLEGFWHAHFGWLFSRRYYSDVRKQYAPHLLTDPVTSFVSKTCILWGVLSFVVPYLIGGWTGLLWGGFVRMFLMNHATYSVNSVCHMFGSKPFETTDESRNEWIVGLLAFGEGWHNNHHAFPRNAFHGMRWWQFDLSGIIIRTLEKLGLAWDVQRVSRKVEEDQKSRAARMREAAVELRKQLSVSIAQAREEIEALPDYKVPAPDGMSKAHARARLEEIQMNMHESKNLKKQRLMSYSREVKSLVSRVKSARA